MAKVSNRLTRIYLDEFNFASDLNSFNQNVTQETIPVTCFSDDGPRRVVGNYEIKAALAGFFNNTDDGIDEQVWSRINDGSDHYLCILPGAYAAGSVAYEHVVSAEGQQRSGQNGGAVLLSFDAVGRNATYRGLVLANKTTTGGENIAGVNLGATTLGQTLAVTFRVVTFSGTNITLKVQESSDDGGGDAYADITGLTSGALTTATCVRVSTTAATEAYKRVVVSGTFSSAVILVTAGVQS
jgi:hypothetical protein